MFHGVPRFVLRAKRGYVTIKGLVRAGFLGDTRVLRKNEGACSRCVDCAIARGSSGGGCGWGA